MLLHFHDYSAYCIVVSFDFLYLPLNEATSVDIFPFTYMKYQNEVIGLVSFLHRFAAEITRSPSSVCERHNIDIHCVRVQL